MSLQLAAQHMASRGRGPDTQLVHMAPQEVAGLQALAKAHGGSLTTNPDTGLPEAGFLSSILPTVIGAGLSVASGGTLTPLMAGMMTGAGYGVATGSLQKGLMAGLGAYGGAGLAGGLMGAGAAAVPAGAVGAVGPQTAAQLGSGFESAMAAQGVTPTIAAPSVAMGPQTAGQLGAGFQANMASQGVQPTAISSAPSTAQLAAGAPQVKTATAIGDRFSQAGRGLQSLLTDEGRTAFMGNEASKGVAATGVGGAKGLLQYGLAAASPMMMQEQEPAAKKEDKPYNYEFGYNRSANPNAGYTGPATGERTYFNPVYTRTAADGGLMDTGPVQSMSDQNQAEMLMINRGQRFDEGGAVGKVEDNPFYTMTGQSGDAFKYLMGQGPKATAPAAAPAPAAELVVTPASVANATGDPSNNYIFNPTTGAFMPLSSAASAVRTAAPLPASYSSGSGSITTEPSAWDNMSNAEKAAYYAANPTMAAITQAGQNLFGMTALGQLAQYANPQAYGEAQAVARGFDPSDTSFGRGAGSILGYFGSGMEATPKAGVDVYGYAPVGTNTGAPVVDPDAPSTFNPVPSSGYGGINYSSPSADTSSYDPSQSYGGGDTTSPSSADTTAADNSGIGGWATGGLAALARGGQSHLGDYSDGGRLLRGPGDGVSDSIPASIGNKRPARLADGEFVVPARIVSELGNGSTEAGARKLYAMMDRVQKARKKSIGKNRVAVNSKADKLLPA